MNTHGGFVATAAALMLALLGVSCKHVEVSRNQRVNPKTREEMRQAKREMQADRREAAQEGRRYRGARTSRELPAISRRFEKDVEAGRFDGAGGAGAGAAGGAGSEVAEVVPAGGADVYPPEAGAPAPERGAASAVDPPPGSSPRGASWLPDGRCYYCNGRGEKFIETGFVSCPHCGGRGRQ